MSRLRKFGTAAATFSVAMGIGFVMQNGDALAARFGETGLQGRALPAPSADVPAPQVHMAVAPVRLGPETALPLDQAVPVLAGPALLAGRSGQLAQGGLGPMASEPAFAGFAAPMLAALVSPGPITPLADQQTDAALEVAPDALALPPAESQAAPDCRPTAEAATRPGALVEVSLTAPCHAGQPVTVHHEGLMFGARLGPDGTTVLLVPALRTDAVIVLDLGAGLGAVASASVPEVAGIDRAVLQWRGDAALNIHAFEFGASFGAPGHVWQAAAGAVGGTAGSLISLGDPLADPALVAQVYTFPTSLSSRSGRVDLVVESEVTPVTCGREVTARTIQMSGGASPFSYDLALMMPGCDAVGEFVVLPDMLFDLTLAAN